MKKVKYTYLIFCLYISLIMPLPAHPPAQVNVKFDPETKLLTVESVHPTPDVIKHNISEIEIKLNGNDFMKQEFMAQSDSQVHRAVFFLYNIKQGDEITVISHCNVFGKKKVAFKIP